MKKIGIILLSIVCLLTITSCSLAKEDKIEDINKETYYNCFKIVFDDQEETELLIKRDISELNGGTVDRGFSVTPAIINIHNWYVYTNDENELTEHKQGFEGDLYYTGNAFTNIKVYAVNLQKELLLIDSNVAELNGSIKASIKESSSSTLWFDIKLNEVKPLDKLTYYVYDANNNLKLTKSFSSKDEYMNRDKDELAGYYVVVKEEKGDQNKLYLYKESSIHVVSFTARNEILNDASYDTYAILINKD